MSVEEQITALEEQKVNTKGPGSVAKKKAIQGEIDDLRESLEDDGDYQAPEQPPLVQTPPPMPPGVDDEDLPGENVPLPTKWIRVTAQQVKDAEANRTLCGYDPDKMIALIKGK